MSSQFSAQATAGAQQPQTSRSEGTRVACRQERLEPIRERGGLDITGAVHQGFVQIPNLTTSVSEAVDGVDLVMLVVPANALSHYASELAGVLSPEVPMFLNPGQTGGGLHFVHEVRRAGYDDELLTCETSIITQVCRLQGPTHVHMPGFIRADWAAFPGKHAEQLFHLIHPMYPQLRRAGDVMETGFANLNALVHPAGMVMNAGWIEHTGGDFLFYREGFTPAIGRATAAIDAERMKIAESMGFVTRPMLEISRDMGFINDEDLEKGDVSEAWRGSAMPAGIRSPGTLQDRYILEGVSYGLVPLAEFGALTGVQTPTMNAITHLASVGTGIPLRENGLTLARMGLARLDSNSLPRFIHEGH